MTNPAEGFRDTLPERVRVDQTLPSHILEIIGLNINPRLFNPLESPTATEELKARVDTWRNQDEPSTVVFVMGTFDGSLHPMHRGFLLDVKNQGAVHHYQKHQASNTGKDWADLDFNAQVGWLRELNTNGNVRLVVSIDGNQRVSESKGKKPEKGGSVRPIYDWHTRAHNVADYAIANSQNSGSGFVADAITIHDQFLLPGTPHADPEDLATLIGPDIWGFYHEAKDVLEIARDTQKFGEVIFACVAHSDYLTDACAGDFSTTALVERIKQL